MKVRKIFKWLMYEEKILMLVLAIAIGLTGFLEIVDSAKAASLTAGPLNISYSGSDTIFGETNYKPGENTSKTLTIVNNGSVNHSFALATENVSGKLADRLYLKPVVNGSEVWSKTIDELSKLLSESETVILSIAPGQTVTVDLGAEMDFSSDNDYQAGAVSFDLVFGTQEVEPTPAVTSSPSDGGITADTVGATGILGAISSFFAGGTATPVVTASPTATASATPEVKGTQTSDVKGAASDFFNNYKNWLLLLITPILAAIVLMVPTAGVAAGVGIPLLGGAVAIVLSYFIPGNLRPLIFWVILICEIVLAVVMNYMLLKKDRIEADIEEKKES